MIKVIVFDLWNTLIPATIDFVHLSALTKKEGLSLPGFIEKYEKGVQLKKYSSFEELRKDFFKTFDQGDNVVLEQELAEVYGNRMDKIRFFPDVEKNLLKLRKQGYKLVLLSNNESIAAAKIESSLNISNYFDAVFYSFDIGFIKPDAESFLPVLKEFKIKPGESLMVGDSLRSDIIGSQRAGMHNCLINRLGKVIDYANAKPEFEVKSLDELYRVLGGLNANKKS